MRTRGRVRYQLCLVGPGHARHALDLESGHVLCGASRRRDRAGRLPILNSHDHYDSARVTCRRCRKALVIGEGGASA